MILSPQDVSCKLKNKDRIKLIHAEKLLRAFLSNGSSKAIPVALYPS